MKTPVTFVETSRDRSTWLWEMHFLTATEVPLFLPGSGQYAKVILWNKESHVAIDVSLREEPRLYVSHRAVY
jgi:hypothetical protein